MKNLIALAFSLTVGALPLHAAQIHDDNANIGELRIMAVDPTPEPDEVHLRILFPEGEVKTVHPVHVEVELDGYPIGTSSEFPREHEVYNSPKGQSVHVFIDNEPYFEVTEAFLNSLDPHEVFFSWDLDFDIPFPLKDGQHVIRMFPVRSYNESLKGNGCYAARSFYWKKEIKLGDIDLSAPYLTYNEPQGEYDYDPNTPILLDFYLANCQLSKDGYKVRLTIDGSNTRLLTSWVPYYVYGLKKGRHKFRLELLDPNGKPVPGLFNDVSRTIRIE